MKLSDFDYELPTELIAQEPVKDRDHSRLLVVNRDENKQDHIQHKHFYNIIDYFNKGDVLIINNTKVLPYKFYGNKSTGGKVEIVLGNRITPKKFEARIKSTKTQLWDHIILKQKTNNHNNNNQSNNNSQLKTIPCKVISKNEDIYTIEFDKEYSVEELKSFGELPLPPYIVDYKGDPEKYQTIYSEYKHDSGNQGSVAAPTAGLHFTDELLNKIKAKGVKVVTICLHVSFGTFKYIKDEDIKKHKMDPEYYIIEEESADTINNCSGNLFVVGTTTLKTLETAADEKGNIISGKGWSDLFIYPGYKFKFKDKIDGFITNFHLPKSSLLMLLSAYWGRNEILDVYKTAVKEKYRFFSFGDSMVLLK